MAQTKPRAKQVNGLVETLGYDVYPVFATYATKAASTAAFAGIPEGAWYIVDEDESVIGSPMTRYRKTSGVAVLDANLDQLRTDLANAVAGFGADQVANADRSFDSVASLRAAPKPVLVAGETLAVTTLAYTAGGSVGGGQWEWNAASAATDNGGTVINPTGNAGAGRWLRIYAGDVNASWFGAVGDGVTDDLSAIQAAVNIGNGRVILSGTNHFVSGAINLVTGSMVRGMGMNATTVTTSANTFSAFVIAQDARKVTLEDFSITSAGGIGASNAGIKLNDINGGAEHLFRNLNINAFFYGTKYKEIFWNSTLENVRWNSCGHSFFGDGAGGQNIENLFLRCYSNTPTVIGMRMAASKSFTFVDCNFGGHPTNTTNYVNLISTCIGFSFIGCNFELAIIAAGSGGFIADSNSTASLMNCTFVTNAGVAATAYEILAKTSAKIIVEGFVQVLPGANISQLAVTNTAKVINADSSVTAVTHLGGSTATSLCNAPASNRIAKALRIIDLSEAAQEYVIEFPAVAGRVRRVRLLYTEASSVDAGVTVTVKSANGTYTYYTGTSEVSKALYYELSVAPTATFIPGNSAIVISTTGGKVGTGEILAIVEYVLDV